MPWYPDCSFRPYKIQKLWYSRVCLIAWIWIFFGNFCLIANSDILRTFEFCWVWISSLFRRHYLINSSFWGLILFKFQCHRIRKFTAQCFKSTLSLPYKYSTPLDYYSLLVLATELCYKRDGRLKPRLLHFWSEKGEKVLLCLSSHVESILSPE